MQIVFLNTPMGTFTPTHSGAIATIIWELHRQAISQGIESVVLSRRSDITPYTGVKTIFVDYPLEPKTGLPLLLARAQRRLAGWTHQRQGLYARRIVQAIKDNALQDHQLVMFNDPEMAVFLRSRFPKLYILHWFQNQLPCKGSSQRDYAQAVNATGAVSDFTSRWVQEYYSLSARSVRTLYNAVDTERFTPAATTPSGPPVINFVGRTGIEKAPDLLLSAAIRLAARTKNFALQILGSNHWGRLELDDYQKKLASLAAELEALGIPVRRPGHIDRASLPAELQKAHIHVVPSRWDEPFGLVTLEGMACGLATVASATGGTPEIIGEAGLLFERDSVEALTDQLFKLVDNETYRHEIAVQCRRRAEEFTWTRAWDRLRGVLAA